ncbi:MAG: hypothetical protein AAGD38_24245, partial [Acidobacteriota bacterium]
MIETLSRPRTVTTSLDIGRLTFPCPRDVPVGITRCVKMHNPDLRSPWDFWLMTISHTVGDSCQVMTIIPLDHGGFRKLTTRVDSRHVRQVTDIEIYESETLHFGFVGLRKTKVRRFYAEMRDQVYRSRGTVQDFDAVGTPLGPETGLEKTKWPDLPGDAAAADLLRALRPTIRDTAIPLTALRVGVAFPIVERQGDDIQVEDGVLFVGDESPPHRGLVVETTHQ